MNVYFTGAQGTGKTTLARQLEELGFKMIPSITRKLIDEGKLDSKRTSRGATVESQKIIFDEYLKTFRSEKSIVSDRFLTDVLAYTKFIYRQKEDPEILNELHRERELLDDLAYEQGLMYGDADALVFYTPVEFEIENDGLRDTDPEYQKTIDEIIKRDLLGHGIRFIELRGTVEERMNTIKNFL